MRRAALVATALLALLGCPTRVRAQLPLEVAPIIEITPDLLVSQEGDLLPGARGRLAELTATFDQLAGLDLPLTLSVSPVFVDELRLIGREGTRAYAALVRLVSQRPVLTRPYADVYLSDLKTPEAIKADIQEGVSTLSDVLGVRPLDVLHQNSLDQRVLDAIREAGVSAALIGADDVGGRVVEKNGITLVPTYGNTNGPDVLADRILRANRLPVAVTFQIGLVKGIAATLKALGSDPRINLVGLPDIMLPPIEAGIGFGIGADLPREYLDAVEKATETLKVFGSYTLEGNRVREELRVLLGLARSSFLLLDAYQEGIARAAAIIDRISEERELISVSGGSVTMTSRRGTVPVTVINLAGYPVRVRVEVSSAKLRFPAGASKVVTVTPRGDTVTFGAEARSTGSFPMTVRLTSPDRRVEFAPAEVIVRSTAANVPALALTLGALVFLLLWSSRGVLLRRRQGVRGSSSADALRSPGKRDTTT